MGVVGWLGRCWGSVEETGVLEVQGWLSGLAAKSEEGGGMTMV